MAKGLTITGMVIAVLLLLLFTLDLAFGRPFHHASLMLDVTFIICALGLGYASWISFRECD